MDGFTSSYRMGRNANGSAIALYVREDVPSRQISLRNDDKYIEKIFWNQPSQEKVSHFMLI